MALINGVHVRSRAEWLCCERCALPLNTKTVQSNKCVRDVLQDASHWLQRHTLTGTS